ncbi:MAG: hypothetical protein WCK43_06450, partial [bacterium]
MDRGNLITLAATIIFATSCAKPDLDGLTTNVTGSIKDMSANLSTQIKGGYSTQEAKNCLSETINIKELELPSKAVVSIQVTPNFFALYTKSKAWTDFKGPNYYFVDLVKRKLQIYAANKDTWEITEEIDLPPSHFEQYLYIPDNTNKKQSIQIKNPFISPRDRLTIRQGINVFGRSEAFDRLTEGEVHAIVCAGALNSFFEKFMKTKYEFSN